MHSNKKQLIFIKYDVIIFIFEFIILIFNHFVNKIIKY